MRLLVTLLITAGVVTLLALDNPEGFSRLVQRVSSTSESVLQDKQVRIDGLTVLSRTEVERLLPLDRAVAWWHANGTEIQAALEKNPWVRQARVSACPETIASRWACFVVAVEERVPTFIANVDQAQWVIDNDGSFIVPERDLHLRKLNPQLIAVSGLASRVKSPDLVRAQLSAAARFLPVLEKQVDRRIMGLELLGQGDFSVSFRGLSFPIVFAGGRDSGVTLAEQGERCAQLLKHLSGRLHEVQKIDLAFSRVGVVTFLPPDVESASKGEENKAKRS
jgi:hypothetical protein